MWSFDGSSRKNRLSGVAACFAILLFLFAAHGKDRARGSKSARAATASASASPQPTRLWVPPRLLERGTELELSGLAYAPSLGRYLLVSDDTGRKDDGTAHAPWLFTMTPSGELDEDPISIEGIERMNDAESIAPGPSGTFFVATSGSPNKKGNTGKERALLLQLELTGRTLQVVGRVNLRSIGVDDLRGGSVGAGLDPHARLDIEGIAFRDGELFLGLKSPLALNGSAALLRLSQPLDAMRAGHLAAGALRLYAEVRLTTRAAGTEVLQGISDLSFLPDGSLLILANSPKGMPKDGGGALFHVKHPSEGLLDAVLVRHFPGLKPEGVSPAPGGQDILIVFDRDRAAPAFIRLSVPH